MGKVFGFLFVFIFFPLIIISYALIVVYTKVGTTEFFLLLTFLTIASWVITFKVSFYWFPTAIILTTILLSMIFNPNSLWYDFFNGFGYPEMSEIPQKFKE